MPISYAVIELSNCTHLQTQNIRTFAEVEYLPPPSYDLYKKIAQHRILQERQSHLEHWNGSDACVPTEAGWPRRLLEHLKVDSGTKTPTRSTLGEVVQCPMMQEHMEQMLHILK